MARSVLAGDPDVRSGGCQWGEERWGERWGGRWASRTSPHSNAAERSLRLRVGRVRFSSTDLRPQVWVYSTVDSRQETRTWARTPCTTPRLCAAAVWCPCWSCWLCCGLRSVGGAGRRRWSGRTADPAPALPAWLRRCGGGEERATRTAGAASSTPTPLATAHPQAHPHPQH